VISGGIDYVGGGERGVKFGFREILGVEMDIDLANEDALEHSLGFLEDACRDFDSIQVPISWLHGAHDAWMDLGRVRHALSHGRQDNRKLLLVPTGHQLRTSREALETFQLISQEIAEISLGRRISPVLPDLGEIESVRAAERARLPEKNFDPQEFWSQYLLGREGRKGMDLMLESPSYLAMVRRQVDLLNLRPGMTVLDLGCGTGALVSQLIDDGCPDFTRVICVDFVRDALRRVVEKGRVGGIGRPSVQVVAANLSPGENAHFLPVVRGTADVVVASLLLSYVKNPEHLLAEMFKATRPGGRVLVSTLRQDADFSKIWVQDEKTLRAKARTPGGSAGEAAMVESLQSFLNDAARVLDLEESGVFRFWEPEGLASLVEAAGFREVAFERALGDPPQAAIVTGRRH
jgi:ubiquinone/menaquinone biosynthesis C-methylase UbiE